MSDLSHGNLIKQNGVLVKQEHLGVSNHQNKHLTIPASPAVSSSIFSNGGQYDFEAKFNSVDVVKKIDFEGKLVVTSASVGILPFNFCWDKIEIHCNNVEGQQQVIYNDESNFALQSLPEKERKYREKQAWYGDRGFLKERNLPVGTHYLKFSIPTNFLERYGGHTYGIDSILFRIYFRSDIVTSGSVSNISLSAFNLNIECAKLSDYDRSMELALHSKFPTRHVFVEPQRVSEKNLTWAASTQHNIRLDGLNGCCPFMVAVLKNGTSPGASSGNLCKYVHPGNDCTVDIVNSSGTSLYGLGNAVKVSVLRDYFIQNFPYSDFNKGQYQQMLLIPFCDDVQSAWSGNMEGGYFKFNGNNDYQLRVTTGSAATSEVHTFTLTNAANDSGFYRLALPNGEVTDSLAYNDSVSVMKAAVEALPYFKKTGITATFSGTAEASFTLTLTGGSILDDLGGAVKIICDSLNDGGVAEDASSSVTTVGIAGSPVGSSYSLEIYGFMYKEATFYPNGRIETKNM